MSTTRGASQRNANRTEDQEVEGAEGHGIEEEYGDMHRIVLQGIIAAGFLDAKGVKTLFTAACDYLKVPEADKEVLTSMPTVLAVVRKINKELGPLGFAIKSASCELTARKFFLFMPTSEKASARLQSVFTKTEIEMFQTCLDRMLRNYVNFAMPLSDAINVLHELEPRAPKNHAEEFVQRLIDMQYFTKYMINKTEYDVTLGIRSIRELEPLIREIYVDVLQTCFLCKTSILNGFRCPGCKVLVHKLCHKKYVASSQICPNTCGSEWQPDSKNMVRRSRTTDEIIEKEGIDVDLSNYRTTRPHRSKDDQDDSNVMPTLEPQVSGRRRR